MAEQLGAGDGAKKRGRPKGSTNRKPGEVVPLRPAPPAMGDNSEELRFLAVLGKVRSALGEVEEAKAVLDTKRSLLNDVFTLAKADPAKWTRKEIMAIVTDGNSSRRDLEKEQERRAKMRAWAGLPAGSQADLFANTPQEARDEIAWEADGYQVGVRAGDAKPPKECSPRFHQAWMKGYHNGQARNGEALKLAHESAEAKRKAEATPVEAAAAGDPAREPDLKAQEAAMRESLDRLGAVAPDVAAEIEGGDPDPKPEGWGESSEAELAAQVGRPGGDTDAGDDAPVVV